MSVVQVGDRVIVGGDTSSSNFRNLLGGFPNVVGRVGKILSFHNNSGYGVIADVEFEDKQNCPARLYVTVANLLLYSSSSPSTASLQQDSLAEQVLALPTADRQRLYKLLYNSGCRINR